MHQPPWPFYSSKIVPASRSLLLTTAVSSPFNSLQGLYSAGSILFNCYACPYSFFYLANTYSVPTKCQKLFKTRFLHSGSLDWLISLKQYSAPLPPSCCFYFIILLSSSQHFLPDIPLIYSFTGWLVSFLLSVPYPLQFPKTLQKIR